ncbi:MAG TPA: bifunctional biotin--[acetyl-CoA-carboxylase] ligase/biotin operon repressor BirA [Gammaproteobacteria bacterium]|nr:bifunctional biotin--[acetyl-CoA-carboxylase] ligase/biotin operon repressor BirA [Gammaproteobacteria bacterium]
MSTREALLQLLADGRVHSGEDLAQRLAITRAAVWKQLRRLEQLGLEIRPEPGRGYRLVRPLELLDRARILEALSPVARERLESLEIFPQIASTNAHLLDLPASAGPRPARACLAEHQSAGRGRRGRAWLSPFAANIYLSVRWRFDETPPGLSALALCIGVASAEALHAAGAGDVRVKWPNDLLWQDRKLGGVLLEIRGEAAGRCDVVVGIGLNVSMPPEAGRGIDQPWVDLDEVLGGRRPHRNDLAAGLLERLTAALARFGEGGFTPFRARWAGVDAIAGREVDLQRGDATVTGIADGVDDEGALRLRVGDRIVRYVSGDVSLRIRR